MCPSIKSVSSLFPNLRLGATHQLIQTVRSRLCCIPAACNVAPTPAALVRAVPTASYVTCSLALGRSPTHSLLSTRSEPSDVSQIRFLFCPKQLPGTPEPMLTLITLAPSSCVTRQPQPRIPASFTGTTHSTTPILIHLLEGTIHPFPLMPLRVPFPLSGCSFTHFLHGWLLLLLQALA